MLSMTHHREQQKNTFRCPYGILKIVGDGMFEWAVISKRSFGPALRTRLSFFPQILNIIKVLCFLWIWSKILRNETEKKAEQIEH